MKASDSPNILCNDEDAFWSYRDNMFEDYSDYLLQPEAPDLVKERRWTVMSNMGGDFDVF